MSTSTRSNKSRPALSVLTQLKAYSTRSTQFYCASASTDDASAPRPAAFLAEILSTSIAFRAALDADAAQRALSFAHKQSAVETSRRQNAAFKLEQARAQLMHHNLNLGSLPLRQEDIQPTIVPVPAFETPITFRTQYTIRRSSLAFEIDAVDPCTCTCASASAAPLPLPTFSFRSWADDEEDEEDDESATALIRDWGLSVDDLAAHGIHPTSIACSCSLEVVDLPALRKSLPLHTLQRIAHGAGATARSLSRFELLVYLVDKIVEAQCDA